MNKIILHIPHSSTKIPFYNGYTVSEPELNDEIVKLTDWYTDDLFQHNEVLSVITPFSRIFCDIERFSEDKDEVMAKWGMGMLYTTFDDGRPLREVDKNLRNKIYTQFYQNQFS